MGPASERWGRVCPFGWVQAPANGGVALGNCDGDQRWWSAGVPGTGRDTEVLSMYISIVWFHEATSRYGGSEAAADTASGLFVCWPPLRPGPTLWSKSMFNIECPTRSDMTWHDSG